MQKMLSFGKKVALVLAGVVFTLVGVFCAVECPLTFLFFRGPESIGEAWENILNGTEDDEDWRKAMRARLDPSRVNRR